MILDAKLYCEMLHFVLTGIFVNLKIKILLFLLTPFNQESFITDDRSLELLNIHIGFNHALLNKPSAITVSPVQIYGSHQSFKKISMDVVPKLVVGNIGFHKFYQPQILSQFVQVLAAHNFGPHFSEVTFISRWNLPE